jgi:uncharacterized protein
VLCPLDQSELKIADRSGIEIDYCPKCRGVWLDRGELDKLIERAGTFDEPYEYARTHDPREREREHYPKKKPKSFLKEMLDF